MLEAARQGNKNCQGVRGELNPPPRPSQGRMLASYTTNTIGIESIYAALGLHRGLAASGPGGDRTHTLLFKRQALRQLSYKALTSVPWMGFEPMFFTLRG